MLFRSMSAGLPKDEDPFGHGFGLGSEAGAEDGAAASTTLTQDLEVQLDAMMAEGYGNCKCILFCA